MCREGSWAEVRERISGGKEVLYKGRSTSEADTGWIALGKHAQKIQTLKVFFGNSVADSGMRKQPHSKAPQQLVQREDKRSLAKICPNGTVQVSCGVFLGVYSEAAS